MGSMSYTVLYIAKRIDYVHVTRVKALLHLRSCTMQLYCYAGTSAKLHGLGR